MIHQRNDKSNTAPQQTSELPSYTRAELNSVPVTIRRNVHRERKPSHRFVLNAVTQCHSEDDPTP